MQTEDISKLVKWDGLNPEETVLIHGTSIEATLDLIRTGKLQVKDYSRKPRNEQYKNYLFFTPNGDHFNRVALSDGTYVNMECDWENALIDGEIYAGFNASYHYITSNLGFTPKRRIDVAGMMKKTMEELLEGVIESKELKLFLKELDSKGIPKSRAMELVRSSWQRKGVLLGIGKNIFDQKIENGKDTPGEEVCIYLPNGLDRRYVNGIHPIGVIERRLLREYLTNSPVVHNAITPSLVLY